MKMNLGNVVMMGWLAVFPPSALAGLEITNLGKAYAYTQDDADTKMPQGGWAANRAPTEGWSRGTAHLRAQRHRANQERVCRYVR